MFSLEIVSLVILYFEVLHICSLSLGRVLLQLIKHSQGKRIWFWLEKAVPVAEADASGLRIHKQSKHSAYSQYFFAG